MWSKIIREPLVHFLLAGFVLFLIYPLLRPDARTDEERSIRVTKEALLTMMQYRGKSFRKEIYQEKLEAMDSASLDRLIKDYIRDEVMYRRAREMGLNESDYVIRQRMIQKVDFLLEHEVDAIDGVSEDSLRSYFRSHQELYSNPALYTFRHIYFRVDESNSTAISIQKAERLLRRYQSNLKNMEVIANLGDRFLYHRNYIERDLQFIKSHFGEIFVNELIEKSGTVGVWQGPIVSDHGIHLIYIVKYKEAFLSPFESVREKIHEAVRAKVKSALKAEIIEELIDQYEIVVDPVL